MTEIIFSLGDISDMDQNNDDFHELTNLKQNHWADGNRKIRACPASYPHLSYNPAGRQSTSPRESNQQQGGEKTNPSIQSDGCYC